MITVKVHESFYYKVRCKSLNEKFIDEGFVVNDSLLGAMAYLTDYYGEEIEAIQIYPTKINGPILIADIERYQEESGFNVI